MNVRKNGDWESWEKFFLTGVAETSEEATETAKEILKLKSELEKIISGSNNANYGRVLNFLFTNPVTSKPEISNKLGIVAPTVGKIVDDMCQKKILVDITPKKKRYKKYSFKKYVDLLNNGTEI